MTKKKRYPDSIPFHFMGFDWEIKFLDSYREDTYGVTSTDSKYIHIYYGKREDQDVMETLLHELSHAMMLDLADSIFHFEKIEVDEKEENLIRLTSPRIFSIIRDNPKLVDFIVKRIKELK